MKHYYSQGKVYAFEMDGSQDHLITEQMTVLNGAPPSQFHSPVMESGIHKGKWQLDEPKFIESKQIEFTAAIQKRLDDFAKTRNYDSALSAASYATSTNPKFAAEGQYMVEVRDDTWAAGYLILDDVIAGNRPVPNSIEDFEDELPQLEWPE